MHINVNEMQKGIFFMGEDIENWIKRARLKKKIPNPPLHLMKRSFNYFFYWPNFRQRLVIN